MKKLLLFVSIAIVSTVAFALHYDPYRYIEEYALECELFQGDGMVCSLVLVLVDHEDRIAVLEAGGDTPDPVVIQDVLDANSVVIGEYSEVDGQGFVEYNTGRTLAIKWRTSSNGYEPLNTHSFVVNSCSSPSRLVFSTGYLGEHMHAVRIYNPVTGDDKIYRITRRWPVLTEGTGDLWTIQCTPIDNAVEYYASYSLTLQFDLDVDHPVPWTLQDQ